MCAPEEENGDKSEAMASSSTKGGGAWPEETTKSSSSSFWSLFDGVVLIYKRWTYSYMNTVLAKGNRQTLHDGTHLEQEDLFGVPPSMESKLLADRFL